MMKPIHPIKIIVIGCGNMGASHARAYHHLEGFELVGLIARGPERRSQLAAELGGIAQYDTLEDAIANAHPQAAAICTYPDSHADYALRCLDAGLHIFMEKPLAETVEEAREILRRAQAQQRKVVIGYILRHHPAWIKFVEIARTLGKPLVMRMNLNQQSNGREWETHRALMQSMSPIVDCGVHYVDIMCQMTGARPLRVQAIGARLSEEIAPEMYNYGQLQVVFDDGSVGWYEAGWGPMMSETAYFVKDVIGPRGAVSIVDPGQNAAADSADIDAHTKTNALLRHHAALNPQGNFTREDILIDTRDEPDHQELCNREQIFFRRAIQEDLDLSEHLESAVNSLAIVLAADRSVRSGSVEMLES